METKTEDCVHHQIVAILQLLPTMKCRISGYRDGQLSARGMSILAFCLRRFKNSWPELFFG